MQLKLSGCIIGLICCLFLYGCSGNDCAWQYDVGYTMDLVLNTSGDYDKAMPNSIASVDVIQVYLITKEEGDVRPLSVLRRQQLVTEVRNREKVVDFLHSFQTVTDHAKGCSFSSAKRVFHIVMFDSKLMRIGYFRYYLCEGTASSVGMIRLLGDEAVLYNTKPPSILLNPSQWGRS